MEDGIKGDYGKMVRFFTSAQALSAVGVQSDFKTFLSFSHCCYLPIERDNPMFKIW